MDDKLKIFWNLDILVKMCRSKSDGPSLRIEEVEIIEKIKSYNQEIEEITAQSEEESYDSSAEMADRNIEIITKKQLQTLKTNLKAKNKKLDELKESEAKIYANNTLLKETKASQEKYIISMQERVNEATSYDVMDRYNSLIAETTEKATRLSDDIEEQTNLYASVQKQIMDITEDIREIEEKIDKKKRLLEETITNLQNKDNYIDKSKKEKNDKKISDIISKNEKLYKRLDEIRSDPKYLESKIKDVINNKQNTEDAKPYLINLINTVIKVPYINVPTDNNLEEELLKATQARDSFANEIDQKSYNILEADTPEKLRIEFLTERIAKWNEEQKRLKERVEIIDNDGEYNYELKNQKLYNMINTMKIDLKEFQRAYDETPDTSISYKASLKAQLDEKEEDIIAAEKIATAFRKDESEDISRATKTLKYECDMITQNIAEANAEIEDIKNRLATKKSGLIDITTKNKDKDTLKELAQIVIDIKHRRQFAETPLEIITSLEEQLGLNLMSEINKNVIDSNSSIVAKDYDEYTNFEPAMPVEVKVVTDINNSEPTPKRGIKVINEATISTNLDGLGITKVEEETSTETPIEIEEPTPEVQTEVSTEKPEEPTTEVEEITEPIETEETTDDNNEETPVEPTEPVTEIPTTEVPKTEPATEIITEPETTPLVEEKELTEDEEIEKEIDSLLNIVNEPKEEKTEEDDETPLDIGAIIESTEEPKKDIPNVNDLSINTMFSNTNNENNDNMVSSDDLTIELDKYISNFRQDND